MIAEPPAPKAQPHARTPTHVGTTRPMHFALGCDAGYLVGAAAAVQSLLARHGPRVRLHLLAKPDLDRAIVDDFARRCADHGATLDFHPIDRDLPGAKQSHLFRLLIPDLIDESIERILYLDSDLVVVDDL